MAKLLKILGRTLGIILEWLLIFITLFTFAIRTSPFQTFLAQRATHFLSNALNTEVNVENVALIFPNEIALEGILIKDLEGDTLIGASTLYANLQNYDVRTKKFIFNKVELEKGHVHLKRSKEGIFNYQFLINYFSSEKKRKKSPIHLGSETVYLTNTTFKYDDNRKKRRTKGVDYFHIDARNINAEINSIKVANHIYNGNISKLSFTEKSGFQLDDLKTKAEVSKDGIHMRELSIRSKKSNITSSKFNMNASGFTDFKHFVDSISFDGKIEESQLDLSEISLFAYVLDGMNDTVLLKTNVSKKVKNMRLTDFDLSIKNKTNIKGTINIPDYRNPKKAFYHEKLNDVRIDLNELKTIQLPHSFNKEHIEISEKVNRLKFIHGKDIRLDGFYNQFVIAADNIKTDLGSMKMDNGIMFSSNDEADTYIFEQSSASEYDVKIESFDLGSFLNSPDLGIVDGIFFLSGEASSFDDIQFNSIQGTIDQFDYLNYPYKNITILEGKLINEQFEGKIDVSDDNLDMTYSGIVDFKDELHLLFYIEIQDALLDKLNITTQNSRLSSLFQIDLKGRDPNDFNGFIQMDEFSFSENGKTFDIPSLRLDINRGISGDEFRIKSEILDARIEGHLNYKTILQSVNNQVSKVFPTLFDTTFIFKPDQKQDNFDFVVEVKKSEDFLSIFAPNLKLAEGTNVNGHFYGETSDLVFDLKSDQITYNSIKFNDIRLRQVMDQNSLVANYSANNISISDSLHFHDVYFKSEGANSILDSRLIWDQNTNSASSFIWQTKVEDWDHLYFQLDPSYFSLKDLRWEINNVSNFTVKSDTIEVHEFLLTRGNQSISLDGSLSKMDSDSLKFNLSNINLTELSGLLSDIPFMGKLNAKGSVSNPYTNFHYSGNVEIESLTVKNRRIGDINVQSEWNKDQQSIDLSGDLLFRKNQTFDFIGHYFTKRKENNLDFDLVFEDTDIQFTNAFMHPDVLSDIKGLLNGTLKISGTPERPILEGNVELDAGSAKVEVLGTHFGLEGPIEVDEYGFYMNGIPVFDEEGNAGKVIGSVYHDNFSDFNFDLLFDLEDDAFNRDPNRPWVPLPLEKFLVLKSDYEPGIPYYGIGYGTGIVNIFGYTDNLEITVDLDTKKGTKIEIPMYGIGEIDEENFIVFVDKDTSKVVEEPKIDFTGVDLDLNFNITPTSEVKIIFNEELDDEITAYGSGDISIQLNNIGDVTMDGVFVVKNGVYDFAMGPVKQKFYINEGGSISWTGDPYDAILNLSTYYRVNANIAAATNNQFGSGSGAHQEILCFLNLSESLTKPSIGFDIDAPNANDAAKSVITRIKSDPDELNRQFFSLLLWKRFQPLAGSVSADGSAAIELLTNQINALLSKLSSDYELNVNMNSDQLSGDNTYEFGVSKGFLDDRLVLSGSFGVENRKIDDENEENLIIGDVHLEYLLNESGTFRINIFNESNDKTIIQNQDQGHFTQGAGLTYKEDFHTVRDFKAIQFFLDIFRKKKNKRYPIKRKRQQVPVPQNNNGSFIQDDDFLEEQS